MPLEIPRQQFFGARASRIGYPHPIFGLLAKRHPDAE